MKTERNRNRSGSGELHGAIHEAAREQLHETMMFVAGICWGRNIRRRPGQRMMQRVGEAIEIKRASDKGLARRHEDCAPAHRCVHHAPMHMRRSLPAVLRPHMKCRAAPDDATQNQAQCQKRGDDLRGTLHFSEAGVNERFGDTRTS